MDDRMAVVIRWQIQNQKAAALIQVCAAPVMVSSRKRTLVAGKRLLPSQVALGVNGQPKREAQLKVCAVATLLTN